MYIGRERETERCIQRDRGAAPRAEAAVGGVRAVVDAAVAASGNNVV